MRNRNKAAQRKYWRDWYYKNKEKKQAWQTKRRLELRQMMRNIKSKLSCIRCGESHPACLEFHHRKGTKKEMNISDMLTKGWGPEKILKEVEKCDVLCSNCHKKEHYVE